jgi:hypothetical protein
MDQAQLETMTLLFKALADTARLRILGLLAERPHAGHELADKLGLTPPTISHHMRRLIDADLVAVTPDAQSRIYSLQIATLHETSRAISPEDEKPSWSRENSDVVRAFFDGPRLRQIPASRKKRVIVLRNLLERFTPGQDYPEREVNAILSTAHDDVATLRRELVDYGFMTRDRGIYRVATTLPDRGPTVAQEVGNEGHWFAELVADATARAVSGAPNATPETPAAPRE